MSKLDIVYEALEMTVQKYGGLPSKEVFNKQIKDLMLEIVGPDTISNHFWQHEFNDGYNHAVKGIRQRVNEL
jgi:hypothetical protein